MMEALCKVVVLMSMLVSGVQSRDEKGCADIPISCEPSKIIVTNHNVTTAFAEEILKQCNAKFKCEVPNPKHECVWIEYRCNAGGFIVDISEMSHIKHSGEYQVLSLMSNRYIYGLYAKVPDIECSLIPNELNDNKSRHINVDINEFSPYANFKGLCFNIEESEAQPFCSGSRNLSTSYSNSINSTTGWHFGLKVSNQIGRVPEFRFWIDISIRPDDGTTYDLECRSDIAALSKSEAKEDSTSVTSTVRWAPIIISSDTIITASVSGGLLFLAVLVIAAVCRWVNVKTTSTTEDQILQMGYVHDYAEIDEFILSRMESSIPTASLSRTGTLESINHSTQDLLNFTGPLGRALPSIPTETISTNQTLETPQLTGHPSRALPSIPTETISTNQTLETPQLTGHPSPNLNDERNFGSQDLSDGTENQEMTHDNNHRTQVEVNDAADYLRPRATSGSAAYEAIPDQQRDVPEHPTENEVDILDDNWNIDDELQEEVIENEYEGLDKEAMEAEKILRRSDEDLYTLMDGKPRHPAQVEEATSGRNESADETDENVARPDALWENECPVTTNAFAEDFEAAEETYDDVAWEDGAVGVALLEGTREKCDEPKVSYPPYLEVLGSTEDIPGRPNTQDNESDESYEYSYVYTGLRWMLRNRLQNRLPEQVEGKLEATSEHKESTDESNEDVARKSGAVDDHAYLEVMDDSLITSEGSAVGALGEGK